VALAVAQGGNGGENRARRLSRSLLREAQYLLDRARVLAEAPAARLSAGGSPVHDSKILEAEGPAMLDRIGERFNEAADDEELRSAIAWAEKQIRAVTHRPDVEPETQQEFHDRLLTQYEGKPAQLVADKERVSLSLVRKIRQKGSPRIHRFRHGAVAKTGLPVSGRRGED
jgi:hypothetical protein